MKASMFSLALICLGTSALHAATYIWTGNGGNGLYSNPGNWAVNGNQNGYYPQNSVNDVAIIGSNQGTITWSTGQNFFGATNTITIGSGSTLLCHAEKGDLNVNKFTLEGNAKLEFTTTNAIGLGRDFTIDFGNFTANSHGSWITGDTLASFWTNGKTVSLEGTFNTSGLTGTGTIELVSISSGMSGGNLQFDVNGLNITSTPTMNVYLEQITENGRTKVLVHYSENIPEPTTVTLSLLGLSGLLLRRRRTT